MSTTKVTLNANQLATLLVFEGACAALQTGANQLGGFLKLEREALVLADAIQLIDKAKREFAAEWSRTIQIVSGMPSESVINGKVLGQ